MTDFIATVHIELKEFLELKYGYLTTVEKSKDLEKQLESVRSLLNDEIIKSTVLSAENDKLKEQNEYLKKQVAALEFNARTDQGLD